ncbi:hypothetical protein P5624_00315 (plasmid) [Bacillus subtilis]|uniref:hypothetical protein n=1 Tax=Bacillus subtilis group TaxID=653685 RepID=UPI00084A1FFE|nr:MULTISPECIES: hypothetical protein [Bacillus subtilis group]MCY9367573.1 hypothetical protein [Bacillus spizizenii]MCY9311721.1 hypothetical protein [Bacillus inaquosorum]ODV47955.1 hypothetical protein BCM26_05985 [Bacillus subtilis]OJH63553.1 hypothetical protein BOH71_09930 [Bacillus subtilis]WEY90746.1 hypothetical protein P5624_00315 [Bacillus subtilis]
MAIFTLSNMLVFLGFLLAVGGYVMGNRYKKIHWLPYEVTLNISILLVCVGVIILIVGYII